MEPRSSALVCMLFFFLHAFTLRNVSCCFFQRDAFTSKTHTHLPYMQGIPVHLAVSVCDLVCVCVCVGVLYKGQRARQCAGTRACFRAVAAA